MKRLALLLVPAALYCGQARYARLGEIEGEAEVQLQAPDLWQPAVRNMPIIESSWIRTSAASRVELELDEGSVLRLGPDSQCELSDYSRLSTGQRITLVSLDHGLAYFTGAAQGKDSLILAVPGAQATVRRRGRVRLEARDDWSQIAVLEGVVRFSSPTAELDLHNGQMTRLEPARPARFYLYREIPPLDPDRWSQERDKVLASAISANHLPGLRAGLADLDASGTWISTGDYGTVWKPKTGDRWAPFRNGKWAWYDLLGYTWISSDPWGWLPYHYGRWMQQDGSGWVWVPGKSTVFKPGDVYWLRGANLAGWGPLAPGEDWGPSTVPRLFLNANTTFAKFVSDAREIDPGSFSPAPKEPLAIAAFARALPSPAFVAARLEATRPALRAGSTRVVPFLTGVTYEAPSEVAQAGQPSPAGPEGAAAPASVQVISTPQPEPPVVIVTPPPPPPAEIFYPAPVYTGIVVVNPPEHEHHGRHQERPAPSPPPATKPEPKPKPVAAPPPPPSAPPPGIPRGEHAQERPHRPSEPPQAEKPSEPDKPIPRKGEEIHIPERGRLR